MSSRITPWLLSFLIAGTNCSISGTLSETTAMISRMGDGRVCNGWVVNGNIVATAAHCVLKPGHYDVTIGQRTYAVFRIWIHPKYSPELLYYSINTHELNFDAALLRIIQIDFSIEDKQSQEVKTLPEGARLFAKRPKDIDGDVGTPTEVVRIEYKNVEYKSNGVKIKNGGARYDICPGDSGSPLYAKIDEDHQFVLGIIVGNAPQGKVRTPEFCGDEVIVLNSSDIVRFMNSIE